MEVPETAGDVSTTGTEVFVSRAGQLLGTIIVADTVRPEARAAIASLRAMRIQPSCSPVMRVRSPQLLRANLI